MMGSYFGGGWGFGFGPFLMIIFWALIIWAIFAVVRGTSGGSYCGHKHEEKGADKALDILKERYAKGELSKEEFDRMKKDLE